jgi:hypothetical protein
MVYGRACLGMDCRKEVAAESAARMAFTSCAGVTVIGSLCIVSPGAVARSATRSSSSWLVCLCRSRQNVRLSPSFRKQTNGAASCNNQGGSFKSQVVDLVAKLLGGVGALSVAGWSAEYLKKMLVHYAIIATIPRRESLL